MLTLLVPPNEWGCPVKSCALTLLTAQYLMRLTILPLQLHLSCFLYITIFYFLFKLSLATAFYSCPCIVCLLYSIPVKTFLSGCPAGKANWTYWNGFVFLFLPAHHPLLLTLLSLFAALPPSQSCRSSKHWSHSWLPPLPQSAHPVRPRPTDRFSSVLSLHSFLPIVASRLHTGSHDLPLGSLLQHPAQCVCAVGAQDLLTNHKDS